MRVDSPTDGDHGVISLETTLSPVDDTALVIIPLVVLSAQTDVDGARVSECSLDGHRIKLM